MRAASTSPPPCPRGPIPPSSEKAKSKSLPTSMEQSGGGQIAVKLARPADGGEDRLSALPDEVLVLIVECLDTTAEAARTSVLARRWRGLWPLLSKLHFDLRPDYGDRIRELLDVTDAPQLCYISVTTKGATANSPTAWLPAAARRLAGGLVYHNMAPDLENFDEAEMEVAKREGTVQLPCFENATWIELHLNLLGLALPSLGVFARLTHLYLRSLEVRGPCELGDLVSSPRCPCLQKLSIGFSWGLGNLSIHSERLLQINLMFCNLLGQLTIVTPLLQKLSVQHSFPPAIVGDGAQGANITAPQIVSLVWMDQYDPRYFHLGNLSQPQKLKTGQFYVYGQQFCRKQNHSCLKLLQQFKVLDSLHLVLIYYKRNICHYQYLLGDMTALPQIMFLHLDLYNHGHSFGASLFHVLGMCIGLRGLSLVLYGRQHRSNLEVEPSACPSGCVCDQPNNWMTDELVLDHLEDAHIIGLRGAEHEVALVHRFLGWATILKNLRITLVNEMTEAKIGEFRQALAGSFRPETCVQFDMSDSK